MSLEGKSYANVTLTSLNGDLTVTVFLPKGIVNNNDEDVFYYSSRFDHGSMIGDIVRKRRFMVKQQPQQQQQQQQIQSQSQPQPPTLSQQDQQPNNCTATTPCPTIIEQRIHVLYGTDAWRQPHNSHWPESGMGLASEFGVGDDGSFCTYRCGWFQENEVTNGVLGYQEAGQNEPFLKIGVGELLKGTCPMCDSTEDYKFNSPYLFASQPHWNLTYVNKTLGRNNNAYDVHSIRLDHEAMLKTKKHGYSLSKVITLTDHALEVTTTLTNNGVAPFSTVWYSHNFFTCDHTAVGPGYSVDLNLQGTGHIVGGPTGTSPMTAGSANMIGGDMSNGGGGSGSGTIPLPGAPPQLYDEPGTWSWATPVLDYSTITPYPNSVHIEMKRALDPGIRVKAEFTKDPNTDGGFTFSACQTSIQSSIRPSDGSTNLHTDPTLHMYAYNLYIERGTLSPEPQILIRNLQPNQSASWTQRLVIQDIVQDDEYIVNYNSNNVPPIPPLTTSFLRTSLTSTLWDKNYNILSSSSSSASSASSTNDDTIQSVDWSMGFILALIVCTIGITSVTMKSISTWNRRQNRGYSVIGEQQE